MLVERGDLEKSVENLGVRYFTLSHVWGSHKPVILTLANYADMKKGLRLGQLPRYFRDAIHMTQKLGGRYLWIDALW